MKSLNYDYILNENTHFNEITALNFASELEQAIWRDLDLSDDKITKKGVCNKFNKGAFSQQEDARLYKAMADLVEKLRGHRYDIYRSATDGKGEVYTSPEQIATAVIAYAKKHTSTNIGKLYTKNSEIFERAVPRLCQYYYQLVGDVRRRRHA